MLRPHVQGVAGGSLGTLLLKLFLDTLSSPVAVPEPPPVLSSLDRPLVEECDQVVGGSLLVAGDLPEWLAGLDLRSFVVGVACGIVLGPVIDFLYLLCLADYQRGLHNTCFLQI